MYIRSYILYTLVFLHVYTTVCVYLHIYICVCVCVFVSSIPFSTGPKYFCRCPRFGWNDFIDLLTRSNVSLLRREVWLKWMIKHPDLKGIVMIVIVWPDTVCILLIVLRVLRVDSESSIQPQASLHVFLFQRSTWMADANCLDVEC